MSTYLSIDLVDTSVLLSWPYPQTGDLVVADFIDVVAQKFDDQYLSIRLPDAKQAATGLSIVFNNVGSDGCYIRDNIGTLIAGLGTVIADSDPEQRTADVITIYLTDNGTRGGSWQVIPFGGGVSAINQFTVSSLNSSIILTDESQETPVVSKSIVVSPPSGNINFSLPASISNIMTGLVIPGYAVATKVDSGTITWESRSITGDGTNIIVTDGSGTNANTGITLDSDITGITSIGVGDLVISGGSIVNSADNGSVTISSKGTGTVRLNGVAVSSDGNLAVPGNLEVVGSFNNPTVAKGWCFFTDQGGTGNSINVSSKGGVITDVTSAGDHGIYYVNFTAFTNTNYAVFLNLQRLTTADIVPFQAFVSLKENNRCTVYAIDTLGNILPAMVGMSVLIYAS